MVNYLQRKANLMTLKCITLSPNISWTILGFPDLLGMRFSICIIILFELSCKYWMRRYQMAQPEQTELPLRIWLMMLTLMPISWSLILNLSWIWIVLFHFSESRQTLRNGGSDAEKNKHLCLLYDKMLTDNTWHPLPLNLRVTRCLFFGLGAKESLLPFA